MIYLILAIICVFVALYVVFRGAKWLGKSLTVLSLVMIFIVGLGMLIDPDFTKESLKATWSGAQMTGNVILDAADKLSDNATIVYNESTTNKSAS